MNGEPTGLRREPVRVASLVTAIMAIVAALIAFNWIEWNEAQVSAFEASLVAALPLIVALVQWVANEVARARVTPLNSPRANDGTPLVPLPRGSGR